MKSKKIYAMFLSTAIAAASCVYASDPKSRPLPCSAAPGSMLGAPGEQSEHTQSGSEGAEETPANAIEGFDHAATPNSPESPSASLSAAQPSQDASNVEQTENTKTAEERFADMMVKGWFAILEKNMTGTRKKKEAKQVALPSGFLSAAQPSQDASNVKQTENTKTAEESLTETIDMMKKERSARSKKNMIKFIIEAREKKEGVQVVSPSGFLSATQPSQDASNVKQTENTKMAEERSANMIVKKRHICFEKATIGTCKKKEGVQVALPSGFLSATQPQCNDICNFNPYHMAFQTLNEIQDYIRRNKGTTDENSMRRWIEGKLPFDGYYEYDAPRMGWADDHYDVHYCQRDDVIDNLLRFFKYGTFNSDDTYECLNDIIACIIWNESESIRTKSVASKSGAQPQCCISMLRLVPIKEMLHSPEYEHKYQHIMKMMELFIPPSASLSSVDPAFTRRLKGSLAPM